MVANTVQKILIDKKMNKTQLAKLCGWSPNALYNRLREDNFKEKDMLKMAEALNCDLEIKFSPRENQSDTE